MNNLPIDQNVLIEEEIKNDPSEYYFLRDMAVYIPSNMYVMKSEFPQVKLTYMSDKV